MMPTFEQSISEFEKIFSGYGSEVKFEFDTDRFILTIKNYNPKNGRFFEVIEIIENTLTGCYITCASVVDGVLKVKGVNK